MICQLQTDKYIYTPGSINARWNIQPTRVDVVFGWRLESNMMITSCGATSRPSQEKQ